MEVKKGEGKKIKNLKRFSLNFLWKTGEGILWKQDWKNSLRIQFNQGGKIDKEIT